MNSDKNISIKLKWFFNSILYLICMEEYGLNELIIGLYLTLGFYAIARTNYFISKRNKNWGIITHRVLHLINLVVYFFVLNKFIF